MPYFFEIWRLYIFIIRAYPNNVPNRSSSIPLPGSAWHVRLSEPDDRGSCRTPTGNWTADIAAFDKVHEQILHMADMLTEGIVKQHPAKFS